MVQKRPFFGVSGSLGLQDTEHSKTLHRASVLGTAFSLLFIPCICVIISTVPLSRNASSTLWDSVAQISTDTGTEWPNEFDPSIAVDENRVYVVWEEGSIEDHDIFYRHYDGTTWHTEQEIDVDIGTEYQNNPSIAVETGKVHVVWSDERNGTAGDIYYRRFDGTSWQPVVEISSDTGNVFQEYPSVAVESDEVHVVWVDRRDGDNDIYYRFFNGTTWQPEQEISADADSERQYSPSIAVYGNTAHVVWENKVGADYDIYYRFFDGTSWQPEQEISMGTGVAPDLQLSPSIAVEGDNVYVVWESSEGENTDICYRHFDGISWQPVETISSDTALNDRKKPSIAVEAGKIHVVWEERRFGADSADIYYRYFDGYGWTPEEDISEDPGLNQQTDGRVAVYGESIHVVWVDRREGDYDIYYRRGKIEDVRPPESSANLIQTFWQITSTFDVEWTAADDYDLADISLYFRYSLDESSWLPWEEWACDDSIHGTSASGVFVFLAPYGDGFYEFYTVASDVSGNIETPPISADMDVGLDTAAPSGSIIVDSGNMWTGSTSAVLTLTYSDSVSGVLQVRYSNDIVWDSETWESPSLTKAWTLTSGDGPKTVYYQLKDNAGLESITYSDSIVLDTKSPTGSILINGGDVWTTSASVNLTLIYSDSMSGVYQVRYSNDGIWDTELWEPPSAEKAWTLTPGDGTKTVYYQMKDCAGVESATYSDYIELDTTFPAGSVLINDGDAWTTSISVILTLAYGDPTSGVNLVRYSNDGVWDTETWESASGTKAWTLTPGDGTKTVYYQVRNEAGLESTTYSDEVGLDTTRPTGSIVINSGAQRTTSTSVTLELAYSDSTSGVHQVRFSNDGLWDTELWELPSTTRVWNLETGKGTRTVYFQIRDIAGLESITFEDDIEFVPTSEESLDVPIVIIVISAIVISIVCILLLETVKYWFLTVFLPLYSRLKREKVLDHETRGMIRGYITANPGDHFNSIKKALDLKNGTLAHHLRILEREDFVKSIKDGKYRRFFPAGARISEGAQPTKIERLILDILTETPGRTQRDIATRLGVSQPAVSYHVNKLLKLNKVRTEKRKMNLRYYVENSP